MSIMKHDSNTQPNLIVHYISHSIPIYMLAFDCFCFVYVEVFMWLHTSFN